MGLLDPIFSRTVEAETLQADLVPKPEWTMEQTLAELHTVNAELAVAVQQELDFLSTHRHLRTQTPDGFLVVPINAHLQSQEILKTRKEFALLEGKRNALNRKRNDILRRYADLKMGVAHGS